MARTGEKRAKRLKRDEILTVPKRPRGGLDEKTRWLAYTIPSVRNQAAKGESSKGRVLFLFFPS